jgi:hypothetical protein
MFVKVKLLDNYQPGLVVSYSPEDASWVIASSVTSPLDVIEEVERDNETHEYWSRCRFAGVSYTLADREIPNEGGKMAVLNGRVYVDNSIDHAGIISPLPRGQEIRNDGELVMVHVR